MGQRRRWVWVGAIVALAGTPIAMVSASKASPSSEQAKLPPVLAERQPAAAAAAPRLAPSSVRPLSSAPTERNWLGGQSISSPNELGMQEVAIRVSQKLTSDPDLEGTMIWDNSSNTLTVEIAQGKEGGTSRRARAQTMALRIGQLGRPDATVKVSFVPYSREELKAVIERLANQPGWSYAKDGVMGLTPNTTDGLVDIYVKPQYLSRFTHLTSDDKTHIPFRFHPQEEVPGTGPD